MDFLFFILICFDNILFVRVCVRVCVCVGFERLCVSVPAETCISLVHKHKCLVQTIIIITIYSCIFQAYLHVCHM